MKDSIYLFIILIKRYHPSDHLTDVEYLLSHKAVEAIIGGRAPGSAHMIQYIYS